MILGVIDNALRFVFLSVICEETLNDLSKPLQQKSFSRKYKEDLNWRDDFEQLRHKMKMFDYQ